MKALLAALVLLTALLAGCGGDDGTGSADDSPRAPYAMDCSISNWADPCTARASPNLADSKAEVDITVNPKDPLNAFTASKDRDRLASDCVWSVGQYTKDGGHTWTTTYIGGKLGERGGTLYDGWHCVTDPIATFNKDGDLFYTLQMYKLDHAPVPDVELPVLGAIIPEGGLQLMAVSHNGGATFPDTYVLHAGDSGNLVFHDYMRTGANPSTGTVYTIWNQLTGLIIDGACSLVPAPLPVSCFLGQSIPVMVAYKPGSALAEPPVYFPNLAVAVQDLSPSGLGSGESAIVAGNDGTVFAFFGGFNSPGKAYIATSTDDGATFGGLQYAFDFKPMGKLEDHGDYKVEYRYGTSVELAIDNSGGARDGCLYATWGGNESGAVGPSDVYLRASCDDGASWSGPVVVNAEHREDGQFMTRVAVDAQGTVHVVYATRAYGLHNDIDIEHAYSLDGGVSFTQELVTASGFDGNKGIHQNGFPFIGDYIGIASAGKRTYLAFPQCLEQCEIGVAVSVAQPAG